MREGRAGCQALRAFASDCVKATLQTRESTNMTCQVSAAVTAEHTALRMCEYQRISRPLLTAALLRRTREGQ